MFRQRIKTHFLLGYTDISIGHTEKSCFYANSALFNSFSASAQMTGDYHSAPLGQRSTNTMRQLRQRLTITLRQPKRQEDIFCIAMYGHWLKKFSATRTMGDYHSVPPQSMVNIIPRRTLFPTTVDYHYASTLSERSV